MVATFSRVKLVNYLHYQTNSPKSSKSKKKKNLDMERKYIDILYMLRSLTSLILTKAYEKLFEVLK